MATANHVVPAGEQFTAIPSAGLFTFHGLSKHDHAVILSIGFRPGEGTQAWSLDLVGDDGAMKITPDGKTGAGYDFHGRLVVPNDNSGAAFKLAAKTKGKTGRGSLSVTYTIERHAD